MKLIVRMIEYTKLEYQNDLDNIIIYSSYNLRIGRFLSYKIYLTTWDQTFIFSSTIILATYTLTHLA